VRDEESVCSDISAGRYESDCEIVKIDFSDNAVGKPVRKIRNRVLWEWKILRE